MKRNRVNFRLLIGAVLVLAVASISFAGCGDIKLDASQLGLGKDSNDLSGIGATPDPSWHGSYLVGAHGGFACADCHASVARVSGGASPFREISGDQICARCHMGEYNRIDIFNHSAYKIGSRCNSCHYSDNFRFHTRVAHSKYHGKITYSCAACHPGKTPANHLADGRTGACEMCHKYPNWQAAGFNHSGVTSGCAGCHSRHYADYACESCHTYGISWAYSHSRVRSDGCPACHGADGHGGGGGGHD